MIKADEKVPNLIWHTAATTHDHQFLEKLKCDEHTLYIFVTKDTMITKLLNILQRKKAGFVTRLKSNVKYETIQSNEIPEKIHRGILSDEIIEVEADKIKKLKLRKILYYDRQHKRTFEFISNLFEFRADTISALYKIHWQIELLFKQIKQNFPLKYFLGDNENAIKIQI